MDFLFIGGAAAAKDKDSLQQQGITHIINCAATVAPSHYPDDFIYYNIRLRDHSSQDIGRYFYNVFDFIEKARRRGGKIFVHCVKGISRSPTMAIAYLMWFKRIDVNKALELVRQARPVVDPNAGFIFQLTEWDHLRPTRRLKLQQPVCFRIDVPDGMNGNGNGARPAEKPLIVGPLTTLSENDFLHPSAEMNSSCFVVSSADYVFVWCGANANAIHVEAAQHAVALLQQFESFPEPCEVISSGQERASFWSVVGALQP
ncbi:hypothetical protein ATCC90586_010094 [Pythium insidiosum]|nr:hypothetical protein ATCC90586_010094 [Pythium insidiosum]